MRRRLLTLALLLGLGLPSFAALAQEAKDSQETALLEARRQQIHELVMIRLNNALALSPTQSAEISQVLNKYRREKIEHRNKIRQLTLQLRQISGSGNETQIQSLIQQITSERGQLDKVDERMFAEAKQYLNTRQQAQFLFVMDEIRREVQAVKRGAPPPGGGVNSIQGGPAAPTSSGPAY